MLDFCIFGEIKIFMKKLIPVLLMFCVYCSRDSDESQKNDDSNKIQLLKVSENCNCNRPISNREIKFVYSGDNLTKIDYGNGRETTLTYSENLLDKVSFSTSSSNMKFNYTNKRLSSVNYNKIPGYNVDGIFQLSYDNNNLSSVKYEDKNNKFTNNLIYTNGKLSEIKVSKNSGSFKSYSIEYDDKLNGFSNLTFEQKILFSLLGENEIGEFIPFNGFSMSSFFGMNNVTKYKSYNFSYQYNGNKVKSLKLTYQNFQNAITETNFEYIY